MLGTVVAGEAPLASGVVLPSLEATTLDGSRTALPKDASGQAFLIVVSFTKAAAKATRPWLDACRDSPAAASVACYDVRMVEEVPRMLRGMMEHGMKSGLPSGLRQRTLMVYEHNEAWRERLGVKDDRTAHVVGCDTAGIVRGLTSGAYSEQELKKLLDAMASPPAAPGEKSAGASAHRPSTSRPTRVVPLSMNCSSRAAA